MAYRITADRWFFHFGFEDRETGACFGFCGEAASKDECEALIDHFRFREERQNRLPVLLEVGLLEGDEMGAGLNGSKNDSHNQFEPDRCLSMV
jgi:hypothetical protein